MHQDLSALLALQADDDVVSELEAQVEAFTPRVRELDRALASAVAEEARARAALEAAEKEEHELLTRTEEQKALHERSVTQLDAVRKPREAAAAMTQAEITRRFLQDMERETQTAVARVMELRVRLKDRESVLQEMRAEQSEARGGIEAEITALQAQIKAGREKREATAQAVPRGLLMKYDRLRGRRKQQSVYPIVGSSCGNCDMAVPIQRRNMMASTGSIEPCEACGVLLYMGE